MSHLTQLCDSFPLAMSLRETGDGIVYVVGMIGIVLLVFLFLMFLTMIPDFLRYLKLKKM